MSRDIDVSLLRAFLAVVETGSVTSAARLLNRTQAAVSQQIKRLEETLGVALFERAHKSVALATEGERLVAHAERMVALNDEIWGRMTTPHFRGAVSLGVPCDILPIYAPPILRRFAAAWPEVQVSLISDATTGLLERLDRGEIDLTLTTELMLRGPHGETLRRDQLVWVVGPDSDAHHRRPLPLAIGSPQCRFRPVALEALRMAGIDWRFVLEVTHQEAQNAAISAGLAVGVMLTDSVPENLQRLDHAGILPDLPQFDVNLYLPATGGTELAQELACHIKAEFAARFGPVPDPRPVPSRRQPGQRARQPEPVAAK